MKDPMNKMPSNKLPSELQQFSAFWDLPISNKARKRVFNLGEISAQRIVLTAAQDIHKGVRNEFPDIDEKSQGILASKTINYFHDGADKTEDDNLQDADFYINLITDGIREVGAENFFTQPGALSVKECIEQHNKKRTIELSERFQTDVGEVIKDNLVYTDLSGEEHVCQLVRALEPGHLKRAGKYSSVTSHVCIGDDGMSYTTKLNQSTSQNGIEVYFLWENDGSEGGTYHQIITYSKKSKRIEQMKGVDNMQIRNDSLYLPALTKALAVIEKEKGGLKSIGDTGNITVGTNMVRTADGEMSLLDIPLDDKPFILKMGKIDLSEYGDNKEKITYIVNVLNTDNKIFTPEQIATRPEQATEDTKVYVGPIAWDEVDFSQTRFKNLNNFLYYLNIQGVEHIYPNNSFPEGRIDVQKNSVVTKSGKQWLDTLHEADDDGSTIQTSNFIEEKLKVGAPEGEDYGESQEYVLVTMTLRDLGYTKAVRTDFLFGTFDEHGNQIEKGIIEKGFGMSPMTLQEVAQAAPAHRMQNRNDTRWMPFFMNPSRGSGGDPSVFFCGWLGGGPILDDGWAFPGSGWDPGYHFVFRLRNGSE